MSKKCTAQVWHRDAYRRTGHGTSGFTLHFIPKQCKRHAVADHDLCRQHLDMKARGVNVVRVDLPSEA